jgi:hypothetical protein
VGEDVPPLADDYLADLMTMVLYEPPEKAEEGEPSWVKTLEMLQEHQQALGEE